MPVILSQPRNFTSAGLPAGQIYSNILDMNEPKKILILFTSQGLGHKAIAENIGYHLLSAGFDVRLEDMLKLEQGPVVKWFLKLQKYVNQHLPFIWSWLYRYGYLVTMPFRTMVIAANSRHVQSVIKTFAPDLIISTQTSSSAPVAYLIKKGIYKNLFAIAFSDFHFHPYWVYPGADHYLVNIEEQKQELIKRGIDSDRITVAGITLKPKSVIDTTSARAKLGLAQDERLILLSSGSQGFGMDDVEELIDSLLHQADLEKVKVRLAIICGKNKISYDRLTKRVQNPRVTVLGFYSPMSELYSIANLYITKPGGLSVAEALQWDLPLLITHWLPGQEELNYQYLQKNGLIMAGPKNPYEWENDAVAKNAIQELKTGRLKQSIINNPAKARLVQDNSENPVLKAIKAMFH